MKKEIDIIENLIEVVSILNRNDEYLESLANRLSECDKLETDYRHLIEFTPIENVNLKKLFKVMQKNFNNRRKIKIDMALGRTLNNNIIKLNNIENREFLIQNLKNTLKQNENLEYSDRILNNNEKSDLILSEKKRGRPKKIKEVV